MSDQPRTHAVARDAAAASGIYFAAQGLLLLAGLISMPLMTRLLSKTDYGLLSVVFTGASALALVGRLGLGEAALRLYSEFHQQAPAALRELCETLLSGTFIASALVALGAAAIAARMPPDTFPVQDWGIALVAGLVVVRAVSTVVMQLYRAQERPLDFATMQLAIRYGTMVVALTGLVLWRRSAWVVIGASLLVETAIMLWRLADLQRIGLIARPRLSAVGLSAVAYGVPLAVAGGARYVLDFGDRLVIERLLGLEAVATYSVPYDLAQRLGDSMTLPVQLAIVPMLFRLWAHEGADATSRVASQVLTYLVALSIPTSVMYLLFNEGLMVLLASDKYRPAAALTPYLLPGVLLQSMTFVAAIGLTAHKRTAALAACVGAAALINVLLNLVFIPLLDLQGAAIATSLGYAILFGSIWAASRDEFRLRIDGAVIVRAALATGVAVALLAMLHRIPSQSPTELALSIGIGAGSALLLFAALDARIRRVLLRA